MQRTRTADTFHLPTLVIAISLTVVYLATLTSDYYWDGITFALQIEKVAKGERGPSLLFHQNHLLYNAIGYLLYKAAHAIGLSIRALCLLQIANAFAGALAVAIFFRLTQRVNFSRYAAVVCSVALAVSAAWWKISTDADAYILSILLILVCASDLLGPKPRWFVAGLALAGAMLIHELAALFYPAALVAVFSNRTIDRKVKFAAWMSMLAWAITISSYYLCAALLHDITHPLDVFKWAISNPSQKSLAPSPIGGILILPKTNIDAIFGHSFALFRRQSEWIELIIAVAAMITALIFVFITVRKVPIVEALKSLRQCAPEMSESRRQIVPVLIAWIGTYILFLLFWEPLIYYRTFYTPALALGIGFVMSNYHRVIRNRPSGAAALAVAGLALFNLAFYIGPYMRADSNVLVAAARNANSVWNEPTVIYFADRKETDTAFEYFNNLTAWRRLSPAAWLGLDREIDRINSQGGSIWLNRGAAQSVDPDWLAKHARGREIEVRMANGVARYVELLPYE